MTEERIKRNILKIVLLCACLIFIPFKDYATEADGLTLYMGQTQTMSVSNPVRIAISNPEIVDVGNLTKSEITLIPKAVGITTLEIKDNFGEQSYKIKVLAEDMSDIKRRIDNLLSGVDLPDVHTQNAEDEGKVLLLGVVKTTQDKERIMTALGPLTAKTVDLIKTREEEDTIEIDVQILELNKDATKSLGFIWPTGVNITEVGSPGIPATGAIATVTGTTPSTSFTTTNVGTSWGKLFKVAGVSRNAFNLSIDILVKEGKARVLSRPRLACQSGKEAELMVGGEKPVFTTSIASTISTSTEVEYKEYGIKLNIKPTVTEDDRIKLALKMEVSDVGEAETIGSTTTITAKAYPLSKRTSSTELYLDDGQTMAIGGLIKQKTEEDVQKVPWLGDLPVVGALFRHTTIKTGKGSGARDDTELFIILTPTVISKIKEGAAKTKKEIPQQDTTPVIDAAAPAPAPAPAESFAIDPVSAYAGIVQKRILENLQYPQAARQAGYQGIVKLALKISYRGELLDAAVKESSGYQTLDNYTINAAKSISSYPPFPSSVDEQELNMEIPIVYRLD